MTRIFKPDSGNDLLLQNNGNTSSIKINDDQSIDVTLGTSSGDDFAINSTHLVVEGDTGNVGIGTTAPTSPITIVQSADSIAFDFYGFDDMSANKGSLSLNANGYTQLKSHSDRGMDYISGDSGMGSQMRFYSGANLRLTIAADGTFTGSASNDISDQRLKENINPISNALSVVNQLEGKSFTWKTEANMKDGIHYGLIAQEVETILAEIIYSDSSIRVINENGEIKSYKEELIKGEEFAKSVSLTSIIPFLIESIKELSAKITALQNA